MMYSDYSRLERLILEKKISFNCTDCQSIIRAGQHSHMIPLKFVNTTNGVYIDVILFYPQLVTKRKKVFSLLNQNCISCNIGTWREEESAIFPLKYCNLDGEMYPCPQNTYSYLRKWYGDLSTPSNKKELRGYKESDFAQNYTKDYLAFREMKKKVVKLKAPVSICEPHLDKQLTIELDGKVVTKPSITDLNRKDKEIPQNSKPK
jgi:hypothetical protein